MEFKNFKKMSLDEMQAYKEELKEEYKKTQTNIISLCGLLEDIDAEFADVDKEVERRKILGNGNS